IEHPLMVCVLVCFELLQVPLDERSSTMRVAIGIKRRRKRIFPRAKITVPAVVRWTEDLRSEVGGLDNRRVCQCRRLHLVVGCRNGVRIAVCVTPDSGLVV